MPFQESIPMTFKIACRIPLIFILCSTLIFQGCAKKSGRGQTISAIDIVQGNKRFEKEILFYYRENWAKFREQAFKEGAISGYRLLTTPLDSLGNFSLILVTEYPDSSRLLQSEQNFQPIMKQIRPHGPIYLNKLKREQFLEYRAGYQTSTLFERK